MKKKFFFGEFKFILNFFFFFIKFGDLDNRNKRVVLSTK